MALAGGESPLCTFSAVSWLSTVRSTITVCLGTSRVCWSGRHDFFVSASRLGCSEIMAGRASPSSSVAVSVHLQAKHQARGEQLLQVSLSEHSPLGFSRQDNLNLATVVARSRETTWSDAQLLLSSSSSSSSFSSPYYDYPRLEQRALLPHSRVIRRKNLEEALKLRLANAIGVVLTTTAFLCLHSIHTLHVNAAVMLQESVHTR